MYQFSTTTPGATVTAGAWRTPVIFAQSGARGAGLYTVARTEATATWTDSVASAACPGGPVFQDRVTLYNNNATPPWSITKFWDGSAWQALTMYIDGNLLVSGTVGAGALAAGSIRTNPYTETTGTIYPEGTTGTYIAAGGGAKISNNANPASNTPILVSSDGIRVGRWKLGEIAVRSLQAIASDSGLIWYRGNISPGDAGGGIPNWGTSIGWVGLYMYSWDATSRIASFQINIRPYSATCNFEGLISANIRLYSQSALGTGSGVTVAKIGDPALEFYAALPFSRGFGVPGTHDSWTNYASTTFTVRYYMTGDAAHIGTNYPAVMLQLTNVQGWSAGHCYYAPTGFSMNSFGYGWLTDNGASWPSAWGGTPPSPPGSSGGGGGGGSGYCVAPESEILMAGGLVKPAGHLAPGDLVCTVPDGGGTLGSFRVRDALIHVRNRVRLALSDGRDLVCSPNHPVMAGGRWREVQTLRPGDGVDGLRATVLGVFPAPSGEVVRLSVDGAQTYCANGILSHNLKAID
jgi:hypothetical protein